MNCHFRIRKPQAISLANTSINIVGPSMTASLALSIAADVLIAGSLTYYLHHSRSGMKGSDHLINRLMVYAINNGMLTSILGIAVIALTAPGIHDFIFLAVFQVIGNLYTNSMLATLNARATHKMTTAPAVEMGLPQMAHAGGSETTIGSHVAGQPLITAQGYANRS
ncbi:hypothetical protein HGRIS_004936 [Hohenbuehelia grisea]|uniref:DUF6534 domain-containing protein n=1 Tax=Hohenbuehelia grisea TaxID=104357 RepID=A0ABR3JEA2_9AGAR